MGQRKGCQSDALKVRSLVRLKRAAEATPRALAQTFKWRPKNPPESDETTCTTVLGNLLL